MSLESRIAFDSSPRASSDTERELREVTRHDVTGSSLHSAEYYSPTGSAHPSSASTTQPLHDGEHMYFPMDSLAANRDSNSTTKLPIEYNSWYDELPPIDSGLHAEMIHRGLSIATTENEPSGLAAMRGSETYIPPFSHSAIYEHIPRDIRADESWGPYRHSHSQFLVPSASTPPPSFDLLQSPVERESSHSISSEKPSTVIEYPNESLHSLQRKSASIASLGRLRERKKRRAERLRGRRQGPPGLSPSGRPTPEPIVTKIEQIDYAEDLMQSIRSRVLSIWEARQPSVQVSLCVPCNVREFMEKQFDGSNKSLGRVVVLSGTATRGQATTCSDYIYSNWPLRGPWLLNMLQDAFDGAGRNAEGNTQGHDSDLKINNMVIKTTSVITVDLIGSKEAAIDVLQVLVWFGAAFQVSPSDQLQCSQSKLHILETSSSLFTAFTVDYEKSPVSEESCWFSLFNNPVIAQGFPIPERRNFERGLELPIELMATLSGGRHAVEFKGGLVIKGHSIAFAPVEQFEDTIQWHMIGNSDGTRLRYSDLRMPRAYQHKADLDSIRTKRAILGWSQDAQTLLGTASLDYKGIDWSEAKEAGRSTRLSGGGLGFQSNLIGQLNFALGAKDGRLHLSHNGPLEKIIELAETTPVVLYDHRERRAWLVSALEVILHVIHTRSSLNLYNFDQGKIKISYSDGNAKISHQAARRAIMASKDQQLYEVTSPGDKAYCVRDAALDIWSLLERMMERDAVITSAPGVALRGTMRDKLYGWEFRALVEEKSGFRQKEQVLEKTNGGWVDLVDDTDTIVLFGNGFQEVIKPVPSCSAWKALPKGKDYLAVGCPMLETLYNEAGSRKTRSYLTSRHLQWHRGSTLFERCGEVPDCACNRLQQLVYDSRITFGRVSPPEELPQDGCVIFGRAHHPMLPAKRIYVKQQNICSIPNDPLPELKVTKLKPATQLPITSLEFRPVGHQLPDGNDSSSVFDSPFTPAADYERESEHGVLALKRRRKVDDQDAGGIDSLNGRHKKSSLRRSSLLCILKTPAKTSRDMRSDLENKDNSEVKSVALNDEDPLDQIPEGPGGKVPFDDYMHCQSRAMLDCNPEVEKDVETRQASAAVNCSK